MIKVIVCRKDVNQIHNLVFQTNLLFKMKILRNSMPRPKDFRAEMLFK